MISKILVVDDSSTDRLIIKNLLNEYNVLTACDGIEALSVIDNNNDIDLVILDLNMPNMNGFEVLSIIKSDEKYAKIRVIILTSYDELENEIKGLNMGAVDYIRKPINLESLKARIEAHLKLLNIEKQYEKNYHNHDMTINAIFQQAPIGISISNSKNNKEFYYVNPMYEKIMGRTKEELTQIGWESYSHPDDLAADINQFEKLKSGEIKNYSLDKRYIKPDGSVVWTHIIVSRLDLENEYDFNYICLTQDITKRKETENKLKYNSEHDMLTGLYNRGVLLRILDQESEKESIEKRAVIGINLSKMYSLNIAFGFNYMQDLIKKVAEALKPHGTENCLLFSTYEYRFVFYIKAYQDKSELTEFCTKIADSIEFVLSSEKIGGGISVVEIDENNKHDIDKILKNLLIASEKAISELDREFGICFFNAAMEEQIMREEALKRELSEIAMHKGDNSERFFLQFQPILNLKTNTISGFEALARMNSTKFGLVSPMEFIHIAEKTKLIIPLGNIIIKKSLHFLKEVQAKGFDNISILINVSQIQLLKSDFVQSLIDIITEMDADAEKIVIEITESVFAENLAEINKIIDELNKYGFRTAIDDFGTGYSSLALERELNVDCLKIDKLFIDKLLTLREEEAISGDIISMAHKLGHCVIAEGVEHEKQKEYLVKNNCDKIQGYLVSKPIDKESAIELLEIYDK